MYKYRLQKRDLSKMGIIGAGLNPSDPKKLELSHCVILQRSQSKCHNRVT